MAARATDSHPEKKLYEFFHTEHHPNDFYLHKIFMEAHDAPVDLNARKISIGEMHDYCIRHKYKECYGNNPYSKDGSFSIKNGILRVFAHIGVYEDVARAMSKRFNYPFNVPEDVSVDILTYFIKKYIPTAQIKVSITIQPFHSQYHLPVLSEPATNLDLDDDIEFPLT